jgi:hypothetical protein
MAVFLRKYDGKPAPSWSYNHKEASYNLDPALKARTVIFNAILSLFGTASRFLIAVPLGKARGQLMWVYYKDNDRNLAGVTVFDAAGKTSPKGAM